MTDGKGEEETAARILMGILLGSKQCKNRLPLKTAKFLRPRDELESSSKAHSIMEVRLHASGLKQSNLFP